MNEQFHFIACNERFVISRHPYTAITEVESDFPDLISWVGPLSTKELLEEIDKSFYSPGTGPFSSSEVLDFVSSQRERMETDWRDE